MPVAPTSGTAESRASRFVQSALVMPAGSPAAAAEAVPPAAPAEVPSWASVVAALPEVFAVIDAEGRLCRCSDRLASLVGWPSARLTGRPAAALVPVREHARLGAALAGARAGERGTVELHLFRRDGTLVRIAWSAAAVGRDHLGAVGRLVEPRPRAAVAAPKNTQKDTPPPPTRTAIRRARLAGRRRVRPPGRTGVVDALYRERAAALGRLASGVAHAVGNPTAFLASNLGTLERYVLLFTTLLDDYGRSAAALRAGDASAARRLLAPVAARAAAEDLGFARDDVHHLLAQSAAGLERVAGVVRSLQRFDPGDAARAEPVDLGDVVRAALREASPRLRASADVETALEPVPPVRGRPKALREVVLVLLENAAAAVTASGRRGRVTIAVRAADDAVALTVADDGVGFEASAAERVFDPFYTTGAGAGLGLTIARGLVAAHDGRLEASGSAGAGAVFTVRLPLLTAQSSPPS